MQPNYEFIDNNIFVMTYNYTFGLIYQIIHLGFFLLASHTIIILYIFVVQYVWSDITYIASYNIVMYVLLGLDPP